MATEPRLATHVWVAAYLSRLRTEAIPFFVTAKGDPTAGAVMVVVATLDGRAAAWTRTWDPVTDTRRWRTHREGTEAEVAESVAAQRRFDRDLWVIEVEDRDGRHLLDDLPGP